MSNHMPSVPQKHPNDRAHLWEYANPHLDPASPVDREWPKTVYRYADTHASQIDCPGIEAITVADQTTLDAALAAGFSVTPLAAVSQE